MNLLECHDIVINNSLKVKIMLEVTLIDVSRLKIQHSYNW